MSLSIEAVNQMTQAVFVATFGAVFEHSPEVARQVWHQRPFGNRAELHHAMVYVVRSMDADRITQLLCAHPDLASQTEMAEASMQEQEGVGLNRLHPDEYELFEQLNRQYKDRFGFPFVIAVKNHTKSSILNAFSERLLNSIANERQRALTEIFKIAEFRLLDIISD